MFVSNASGCIVDQLFPLILETRKSWMRKFFCFLFFFLLSSFIIYAVEHRLYEHFGRQIGLYNQVVSIIGVHVFLSYTYEFSFG